MSEEMVRVITKFQGLEFETVPISQVPAGHILVHIRDHGDFYADPAGLRPMGPVHPPFTPAACAELQKQYDIFAQAGVECATDMGLDRWIDGFRQDRTPWTEMAVWDMVAAGLQRFVRHVQGDDDASVSKRNDVFRVLLAVINQAPEVQATDAFQSFNTLSGRQVKEIVEWMRSDEAKSIRKTAIKKYRRLLRDRVLDAFPDRVGFHSLFTEDMQPNPDAPFNVVEFLATADIIMAEDVNKPDMRCVVHGQKRYDELMASAIDGQVNVAGLRLAFVELDADADELERLQKVIAAVNGAEV